MQHVLWFIVYIANRTGDSTYYGLVGMLNLLYPKSTSEHGRTEIVLLLISEMSNIQKTG